MSYPKTHYGSISRPVANLAKMHLKKTMKTVAKLTQQAGLILDDYSFSHLDEIASIAKKSLDAKVVIDNQSI